MVQKINNDLDVNSKPAYMYYLMSKSGQCSPTSDALDSGTGSDLETPNNHHSYNLPTSLSNAVTKSMRKLNELSLDNQQQRRLKSRSSNDSYNTDSEESESSLSCDSLNSSEIRRLKNSTTTTIIRSTPFGGTSVSTECIEPIEGTVFTSDENNVTKINFLPRSLLRDIRDHSIKTQSQFDTYNPINESNDAYQFDDNATQLNDKHNNYSDSSASYTNEPFNLHHRKQMTNNDCDRLFYSQNVAKTDEPMKRIEVKSENKLSYENDKYISFHLNECVPNNSTVSETTDRLKDDDSFAGYRDVRAAVSSTIRSSKGTIRGVKNRVRNGIATFLQMQQTNVKNYKEKDAGKVVLYSTSMGIVRETYAKCANVKQILRTLLIKFEERDVFMSCEYQQEIKERMQSVAIQVPQLYVDGQYIGDADQVERLNESGELRQLLKPYKSSNSSLTCQICGGYRLLPCPSCNGSKKSVHRNHFTTEFVALKCMNCDEVGLVKCYNCN